MFNPFQTENPLPEFVEVALPIPLRQTFTYRLPAGLRESVKLGARLLVPFGKRQITGYAVALHVSLSEELEIEESALKDVAELIDAEPLITEEILKLTQWTADYYASSWGEVLKASLPAGINQTSEQIVSITANGRDELIKITSSLNVKTQILKYLHDNGETAARELAKNFGTAAAQRHVRELIAKNWATAFHRTLTAQAKPKRRKAVKLLPPEFHTEGKQLSDAQQIIIETLLAANGEMIFTELLETADVGASSITTLAKRGIVEVIVQEVLRDPLKGANIPELLNLQLTVEQTKVLIEVEDALEAAEYKAFLLHGVTGSGKTEIYIRAMRNALDREKSSLMLVPEIALTPIFSRRLRAVFGDEVAILHSNLSTGERFDEWRRIRRGAARIVIGTRSAVFAPLQNVGLIIVDEEHDGSYRQHEMPFYNGRDAAIVRAHHANAVIILGSATPALETFHNAQTGKYALLTLPNRVGNRPLATAEIVDMREVFKVQGKDNAIFSGELITAIEETHERGEQSIILLNRRGYSSFVLCRACGESIKCGNCDITLTFHKREGKLVCHYCNHREKSPRSCPECQSQHIYFVGEGTEQIEDILQRKFSNLRIARVDRDTTGRRKEMERILETFSAGEIDMLVGTQMIAKGHDFHNVTLVGVISVDAGLALPDFRSAERTFQLLTQVAGRAGRGDLPGRVIIQTYYPEHYVLKHARAQDYAGFYAEEIAFRRKLGYPPFAALASILIKHPNHDYAFDNAQILKDCLKNADTEKMCRILGVAPAPLSRLKGEYRLQILIKARSRAKLRQVLDFAIHEAQEKFCDLKIVSVEIDPISLL